jgi:hypothetical protein
MKANNVSRQRAMPSRLPVGLAQARNGLECTRSFERYKGAAAESRSADFISHEVLDAVIFDFIFTAKSDAAIALLRPNQTARIRYAIERPVGLFCAVAIARKANAK